jgi:pilus assembly protein CpaF
MTNPRIALSPLLEDPRITDLCWNGPHDLRLDRGAGVEHWDGPGIFSGEEEYLRFILEELSRSGKTWDAKLPFVDAEFFGTHRAHLVFPPISRIGIALSLRRLPGRSKISPGFSGAAFEILRKSVQSRESLLICGATGSGKTTLFNSLISTADPKDRILALEDTPELRPDHPHLVSLLTRKANSDGYGEVTLRDLVRQTLRMKPDRILIGECRGDEVLDLLLSLHTGHKGSMATLHAESAADAVKRLELLALIAGKGRIPSPLIKSLISSGFQKIVHLEKAPGGPRIIREIVSIEGFERDVVYLRPVFQMVPDGSPAPRGH